jgi:hypothetical protein
VPVATTPIPDPHAPLQYSAPWMTVDPCTARFRVDADRIPELLRPTAPLVLRFLAGKVAALWADPQAPAWRLQPPPAAPGLLLHPECHSAALAPGFTVCLVAVERRRRATAFFVLESAAPATYLRLYVGDAGDPAADDRAPGGADYAGFHDAVERTGRAFVGHHPPTLAALADAAERTLQRPLLAAHEAHDGAVAWRAHVRIPPRPAAAARDAFRRSD